MSMNAQKALMVAITMLLAKTEKAPIIVPVNQDFKETERTAAQVRFLFRFKNLRFILAKNRKWCVFTVVQCKHEEEFKKKLKV